MKRRDFVKIGSSSLIAGCLPVSMVQLAFAGKQEDFTFAYISDSHIQHIKGNKFVSIRLKSLCYRQRVLDHRHIPLRHAVKVTDATIDFAQAYRLFRCTCADARYERRDIAHPFHDKRQALAGGIYFCHPA